jgi:hypothetical protein
MPWYKRDEMIVAAYVIGSIASFGAALWMVFK